MQIIIKKRLGSLDKIRQDEGEKAYSWTKTTYYGWVGVIIDASADNVTTYVRFLVENYPNELLDIWADVYTAGLGKCTPELDSSSAWIIRNQILSTFKFLDQSNAEGKFCGGIAANLPENQCPSGFYCKLDGNYPDASGVCTKN